MKDGERPVKRTDNTGISIRPIWQYMGEPERVHYMVNMPDGRQRHLWQPIESELGKALMASIERPISV